MQTFSKSKIRLDGTEYFLAYDQASQEKFLCIDGDIGPFKGTLQDGVFRCPLNPENAASLRGKLPWLKPQSLGLATSFGFGDRLGIATPGHAASIMGAGIAPIFAQQSVRENTRTGRNPQIVLDDAMWGLFEMGWRDPWGADADHVKEIADLQPFIEAGYTFYTIDPNMYVDVDTDLANVPWDVLKTDFQSLETTYIDNPQTFASFTVPGLKRAILKYGRAITHAKSVSDYLVSELGEGNFDLEISVDETDDPTSIQEHYFIATELRRLEVPFTSLAPRFIGSFEKGVDYIGDIDAFGIELKKHTEVMHTIGGYKLSIHTGSDKFSIYPSIAKQTNNLVHVKTAGTSYLEALRVVATVDQVFFREILVFARSRYETDRATYHVSGKLGEVPLSEVLSDADLPGLFDQVDARQVLHVTFGSVLDDYRDRLLIVLKSNLDLYERFLKAHFKRHVEPFTVKES